MKSVRKRRIIKRAVSVSKRAEIERNVMRVAQAAVVKVAAEARADAAESIIVAKREAYNEALADARVEYHEIIASAETKADAAGFERGQRFMMQDLMLAACGNSEITKSELNDEFITPKQIKAAVDRVALHAIVRSRGFHQDVAVRRAAILDAIKTIHYDARRAKQEGIVTEDEITKAMSSVGETVRVIERDERGAIKKFAIEETER